MKRLSTLILFSFISILMLKAQETPQPNSNLLNYNGLEKQLEKSDKDIANPKKNEKSKTWMIRGELMMDIFDVNIKYLRLGMAETEAKLYFGDTKEVKTSQEGASKIEEMSYPKIILIFKDGKLEKWKEINKIYDNPLPEAVKSFDQAVKLEPELKDSKQMKEDKDRLKKLYTTKAIEQYTNADYKACLKSFEAVLNIDNQDNVSGETDTLIYYNAGLVAALAGLHQESIKYYELARKYNYPKADLYANLKKEYFAIGDTAAGVKILDEGFKKFPSDQSVLVELIRYYLQSGKSKEAMDYLKLAQQGDSTNVSFVFAEGTLYDKTEEKDKAIETYKKCIRMDSTFFNAYYNLGVLYYNAAAKMYDAANAIADNKEYEKAKKAADEELALSIPYMEKAHELDPKDINSLQTLKTIYYRLQMMDKFNEVKEKLDSLSNGTQQPAGQ